MTVEAGSVTSAERLFVVLRFDTRLTSDDRNLLVTAVEILPDEASATREVARLNALNDAKGQRYSVQSARWYPYGRDVAPVGEKPLLAD